MTRKDRLFKNVQKMQQEKGMKNFNFIPTTFLLPYEFEDFSGEKSSIFLYVRCEIGLFSCIST